MGVRPFEMGPTAWEAVDRARPPGGGELVLYRRAGEYSMRVDGLELMSSRAHGSEEALAVQACARLSGVVRPRVLVGGLGMGYTLRATLDALPVDAGIVVAEIVPAVVKWNRGPLGSLAGHPLSDPRVEVYVTDVGRMLRKAVACYDAVLLDVDNGPVALTVRANATLYGRAGLSAARRALRPGGLLAVWSAGPEPGFEERLGRVGFGVERCDIPARGRAGEPEHSIYLARLL